MRQYPNILLLLIATCLLVASVSPAQTRASAPNAPADPATQTLIPRPEPVPPLPTLADNSQPSLDLKVAELSRDYYKDCVTNLKWAIGIIVALVAAFGIFLLFKNTREYRDALRDAKEALRHAREAAREAQASSERAGKWEQDAQQKANDINKLVDQRLKQIEEKVQDALKNITAEAAKERTVSELWNQGLREAAEKNFQSAAQYFEEIITKHGVQTSSAYNNWGNALSAWARTKQGDAADKLFAAACEKYEKAVNIEPDEHEAHYNWGNALLAWAQTKEGEEADKLFAAACEKYQKAVNIKPDFHEAYNNWGGALAEWAAKSSEPRRAELLREAERKLLRAEAIKPHTAAYNLACVYALQRDKEKCRHYLQIGQNAGTLTKRAHAMKDPCLESVRNEDWFKQIRWKGE